jgi:hypothetical protein
VDIKAHTLTTVVGPSDNLTVAVATLTAAGLFRPALRRVQGFVDRRFYRRKYDAQRTIDAFAVRLREETDLDELPGSHCRGADDDAAGARKRLAEAR